jgi:hypothetical protein
LHITAKLSALRKLQRKLLFFVSTRLTRVTNFTKFPSKPIYRQLHDFVVNLSLPKKLSLSVCFYSDHVFHLGSHGQLVNFPLALPLLQPHHSHHLPHHLYHLAQKTTTPARSTRSRQPGSSSDPTRPISFSFGLQPLLCLQI